jgi:hypothetical protein
MKACLYLLMLTIIPFKIVAQAINNSWSYSNIKDESYVRHSYENDFFTSSDELYTQGIHMECVTPSLSKLPTSYLLLHPKNSSIQFGLALQHNGYTPISIQDSNIRYGDRPYGSALMLQPFTIATNSARKQRIATMLSIGVTGKISTGQWQQELIHSYGNNVHPEGWKYQIANDVVLNYRIQYEIQILHVNNILSINATAVADAGSLLTQASAGTNIMLGYFESPYTTEHKRKFAMYMYSLAQVHAVGYNAMLQGGIFSESVYTVPSPDIERLTADSRTGIVIRYGGLYLEYFRTFLTREFITGYIHAWGGLEIGVGF